MGMTDDGMDELAAERTKFLDLAILKVERAIGTERRFLAEPSDEQLDRWLDWLRTRRGDGPACP
jgi:hypothetical protein